MIFLQNSFGRVIAAIGVLVASAAQAQTPAYIGIWASEPAQCTVGQEEENAPLIMKVRGYDQHETHCKFTSISKNGTRWAAKASCDVEGDHQNLNLTLTVAGNRLTIHDKRGDSTYRLCQ